MLLSSATFFKLLGKLHTFCDHVLIFMAGISHVCAMKVHFFCKLFVGCQICVCLSILFFSFLLGEQSSFVVSGWVPNVFMFTQMLSTVRGTKVVIRIYTYIYIYIYIVYAHATCPHR